MIQETMAAPGGGSGLGSGGRRLLKGRFLQQAQPRPGYLGGEELTRRNAARASLAAAESPVVRAGAAQRPHRGEAPVRARGERRGAARR